MEMTDAGMTSGRTKYVTLVVLAVLWLAGLLVFSRGVLPAPLLLALGTAATITLAAGLDRTGRIAADAIAAAGLGLAVVAGDGQLAPWSAILTFLAMAGAAEYIAARATGNARQVRRLQERARLLENIVDTDPTMVFVKDRQSRLTFVNEAVRRFVGLSDAQILGRTDEVFGCTPEEVGMYQESDRAALAADQPVHYPAGVLTLAGRLSVWLDANDGSNRLKLRISRFRPVGTSGNLAFRIGAWNHDHKWTGALDAIRTLVLPKRFRIGKASVAMRVSAVEMTERGIVVRWKIAHP